MDNTEQMNQTELKMQNALGAFLRTRGSAEDIEADSTHLDHDMLTAFVEGNLSEDEAMPVITHMSDCSFCVHVSAELIRLDLAFAEETFTAEPSVVDAPTKVGEVLGRILSVVFGSSEGAVFAHEEIENDAPSKPGDSEE